MADSTLTSERPSGYCPACEHDVTFNGPIDPAADLPCPRCGHLLWFRENASGWGAVEAVINRWAYHLQQIEAERPAKNSPLAVHPLEDPSEVQRVADLFWDQLE